MKIKYNLDRTPWKTKPTASQTAAISSRLRSSAAIVETDPAELLEAIEHGYTFTPAVLTGSKSETWQSQQIIVADIDNDGDTIMQPGDALQLLRNHDIDPFCVYFSFSNTIEHPKYRIMVILSEPITAATEARDITERLSQIFNDHCEKCADEKIKDAARLIFGTRTGSIFYKSGTVTPLDIMRKLPPVRPHNVSNDESITNIAQQAYNATQSRTERHTTSNNKFDLLEPLRMIPPTVDYDTWYKIGMALKQEGYTLEDWRQWSYTTALDKHGKPLYKEGECEEKWQTFGKYTGKPVTGAYITDTAKQYGYKPPRDRVKTSTGATSTPTKSATVSPAATAENVPPPTDQDAPPITTKTATPETPPEPPKPEPSPLEALEEFENEIKSHRFEPIKTEIEQLDKALQGGLRRRTLVTLAAAPGAGKTAIAQYILENMANHGHTVIYVNLEMDRAELLSRSISRISHQAKLRGAVSDDLTALQVERGYKWTDQQKEIVNYSIGYYKRNIAPNFYYVTCNPENVGSIDNTLSDILAKLEKITAELKQQGKEEPLVCIDYLQFIEYDLWKYEDGQRKPDNADAIKQTLKALKTFAMSHNTCVLVITANNRASNQDGRASMDSGRDTSNIEYSGDVMLSLVYTAIEEKWKYEKGTDKSGNTIPGIIDNEFIKNAIDYTLQQKEDYPLIAKLLSLKVVKGRSIMSRGVAKFIYDGRYFYFDQDKGTPNPYWIT